MNGKLMLKMVFLIVVLFLLVLMGMHNQRPISFSLPPLIKQDLTQPAAFMYLGFFAIGLITGTVLTAGGKKGGGSGGGSKSGSK